MSGMTKLSASSKPAAVLTGGKSSRLGRDKSLLRLQGATLTARMAGKLLRAGFSPVFVVGPKKNYGLPAQVAVIGERHRGRGPLSGIEAALRHAKTECLVTPCDLPFISVRALRRLRLAFDGRVTAFAENPLPAIFIQKNLASILRRLASGRLAVFPFLKNARLLEGLSTRQLLNLNDKIALKIVRSDKRVAKKAL